MNAFGYRRVIVIMLRLFSLHRVELDWPAVPAGAADSSWPELHVGPGLRRHVGHSDFPHRAFWSSVYADFRARTSSIGRTNS